MIRKIIKIDENLCNGCGICAEACHEGAIGMVDGKARLLREDYCDGLGDCLPSCPTGAITFEKREAPAYDEEAVKAAKQAVAPLPCGCPGTQARRLERKLQGTADIRGNGDSEPSELRQWPVQIRLAPAKAPYFENAHLLIAADCAAYAYGAFHRDFIKNRIALIGCPKLDAVDYAEKLTEILTQNAIKSVTVVRMEVPCCGGIEQAVKSAMQASGRWIPWQVITLSTDGRRLE